MEGIPNKRTTTMMKLPYDEALHKIAVENHKTRKAYKQKRKRERQNRKRNRATS